MKVFDSQAHFFKDDPINFFDISRFKSRVSDKIGILIGYDTSQILSDSSLQIRVHLNFEEPNVFGKLENIDDYLKEYESFEKIFTLCPYTTTFLNNYEEYKHRTCIFFPFNIEHSYEKEKRFDVIYTGGIHGRDINNIVKAMQRYKACVVSVSENDNVTHKNVSYKKKMSLVAESKISIIHNQLSMNIAQLKNLQRLGLYSQFDQAIPPWLLRSVPNIYLNKLPYRAILPQIKSRLFEAAFSKTLILCKRDQFNVIEHFFEPGKDFLYFDGDLSNQVDKILSNYRNYRPMVESAYEKAKKMYSVEAFVDTYLVPLNDMVR